MFRFAFLLNPPVPLFKGGTYESLKTYQHAYGRNEQCLKINVPPLFKKGGQGGFYSVAHFYQSEHIHDISYIRSTERNVSLEEY
jgi:hypothetical protein